MLVDEHPRLGVNPCPMITEAQARAFFYANIKLSPEEFSFITPHTRLVVEMAALLAQKEGQDVQQARIAAWLHDIGYRHGFDGHAARGLSMCKEAQLDLNADIEDAIVNHPTHGIPKTALGTLIQRADKLSFVSTEMMELLYPEKKELIKEMLRVAERLL